MRNLAECVQIASEDHTARTALLAAAMRLVAVAPSGMSGVFMLWVIFMKLTGRIGEAGWASLVVINLFFGGRLWHRTLRVC